MIMHWVKDEIPVGDQDESARGVMNDMGLDFCENEMLQNQIRFFFEFTGTLRKHRLAGSMI